MRKFIALITMMILSLCLLCGCGNKYNALESTVFVLKNGKVVSTDVEQFSTDTYSEDELKKYVDGAIEEYNDKNGKKSVKLKKLSIDENVAVLTIEYENFEHYAKFNGTDFFVGTIAETLAQGYEFSEDFAKIDGDKIEECSADEITNLSGYNVAVIRNNVCLKVYGDIEYATIENTKYVDKNTISIKETNNLLQTASENTEKISDTEKSTQISEVQSDQGSVGEDELLTEEEITEEFDFSEEPVEESDYTNVYTYVIFK